MHADNRQYHHNMLIQNIKHYIRRYGIHKMRTIRMAIVALYRSSSFIFEHEVAYDGIDIDHPDRKLRVTIKI